MGKTECGNASGIIRKPDTEKIESLLQSGGIDGCRERLGEILSEAGIIGLDSLMVRLYVSMEIYIAAHSFASGIGIDSTAFCERFGTVDDIGGRLATQESSLSFLTELVQQCIMWRIEAAAGNGAAITRKAKQFIDRNYMNEDVSLRTVAAAVGLSPSYLSALFKKESGENLSEYLTRVRIHHSKELLCCTSKLISEIAYDVGYRDYRYFSQIFKKHTGLTPRQFQSMANVRH